MSRPFVVAAAELSHETNTFSVTPTDLAAFARVGLRRGPQIDALRDTATSFAGFFDGAATHAFQLAPLLAVWATPSGMVDGATLSGLVDEILAGIQQAQPDGVLLALHGAMVSDVAEDADGWLLEQVRDQIGSGTPLVATLDMHANITHRMVVAADILIGYDTYPHIDQRERAREACDLLARLLRREIRPTAALVKPPMMPTSQNMLTGRDPMGALLRKAWELEALPGVLNATVAGGFPPADTVETGFAALITTDNDPALAQTCALELAQTAWATREGFLGGVSSWREAAELIAGGAGGPLVLVDIGDNPWTGGPGDSAELLRFLLDEGIRDAALASIVDAQAVQRCMAAGVGAEVDVELGGHTDQMHGEALPVRGYVRMLADGRYTNAGPMHAGVEVNLGPTAVLEVGGVEVLVISFPETPIDLNVFRTHGIEPTLKRVLALKGKGHFRAAFTPIAERIVLVEGPGITGSDLSRLNFRRVPRPIWPLELDTIWTNASGATN